MLKIRHLLLLCLIACFTGAALHAAPVDDARIRGSSPDGWLTYGLNYAETRESALDLIDAGNVQRLGLVWSFDLGTKRGLEATPLVIDGVIYLTGTWSVVHALDATSGELLWTFDPKVPRSWGVNACCDVVNRGVAAWGGNVYVGTLDGRLIALDRATGEPVWETITIDPSRPYTITGAPRVVRGRVIIGNGGSEYGVRGYVSAYDADTGALDWRFHTVPGNPDLPFENPILATAARTWSGDLWWEVGGGGTVWDAMAYDPELDLLYIGVGNGAPWNRHVRSPGGGDNLFLSSVVALRPETGEYVWHYQTTPGDSWDYTATQHMILADIVIGGVTRKVLMQAPKNGFFYVLDRATGELLSAEKYVEVTWASHVDIESGRPVETENADHSREARDTRPAPFGGHNWHPMAFNHTTGLVYIPAMETQAEYSTPETFKYVPGSHWNLGQARAAMMPPMNEALARGVVKRLLTGHLSAWDPVAGREVWRVEHASLWNGGVLTTAGNLVFQGTGDGRLVAYRADTGERLWQASTGTGVVAPPVTWLQDGVQYLAVLAGWGGAAPLTIDLPEALSGQTGRLLVYALDGTATLPPPEPRPPLAQPPARTGTGDEIERGEVLYAEHCGRCHGGALMSSDIVPDLRRLPAAKHDVFRQIVLDGILQGTGMVGFRDVLNETDADAIQAYVLDAANDRWEEEQLPAWWRALKAWVLDKVAALVAWYVS
ncbi:MAG: PQQ-dependent dehydrogenase, methanol/ethanol family [Pseudomonadales bacterium]